MNVGRPAPAGTDLGLTSSFLTVALAPWQPLALRRSSTAAAILRASSTSIGLSPSDRLVTTVDPCHPAPHFMWHAARASPTTTGPLATHWPSPATWCRQTPVSSRLHRLSARHLPGEVRTLSSPTDVPAHPDSAACAVAGAPTDAPSQSRSRWWLAVALLACAGIATIYHSFRVFLDLDVSRRGVQQWRSGGALYGTLPAPHGGARLPFIYPPFAAVALSPIALIPWNAARAVNFGLAVAALGVTIYLSTRRLLPNGNRQDALLVSGLALPLALWLEPVRETVGFGQINLILMALVAADCLVDKPRWPRGALTGIAAAIKLTPAVFLLYFLIRRDIRASVVTIVSAAPATAAGFVVLPRESLRYWFGGFAGAAGISGSPYATNQTVKAPLARLGLPPLVESRLSLLVAPGVPARSAAGNR